VGLEPLGNVEQFKTDQAARIRKFLTTLAKKDALLHSYINDRVAVLQNEVKANRLTTEDVALLLDNDYARVYEVMSHGSTPAFRWIIIWII
jgi:hypothetical protein